MNSPFNGMILTMCTLSEKLKTLDFGCRKDRIANSCV